MITRWCRLTAGERPCCLKGKAKGSIAGLPDDNPINQGFLLSAGLGQVDFRGLNAFMAQKVSQQGDIVKFCQEIFGIQMAERVGIDGRRVDALFCGEFFQLAVYPPGRYRLSLAV